jgi:two-component system sensor histidine kinase KdpD
VKNPGSLRGQLRGIAFAVLLVAAMTGFMLVLWHFVELTNRSVLFLIPVIVAASRWGVLPAIVAAVAGMTAAVYFFFPPLYSFKNVSAPQLINLGLFLTVAIVTGRLATTLKRQVEIARRSENDLRDVYAFSRRLAVAQAASDIYAAIQDHLSNVTQRRVVLFRPAPAAQGEDVQNPETAVPQPVRATALGMASGTPQSSVGATVADDTGNLWLVRRVSPRTPDFGVIAVDFGDVTGDAAEEVRQRIDDACSDAAATLERLDIARAIHEARMRAEMEQLREALIGSVSHELRTPLASILGAATVLRDAPAVSRDERLASLATVVRDEAERLNHDIQNLLDATRISREGIRAHLEWAEPADIVNSALERRRRQLAAHPVSIDVAGDLPLIYVDPVLIEQALTQILDNAAKYSAPGTAIRVAAREHEDGIVFSVSDRGAGLAEDELARVGERFFRAPRHAATIAGSGLGLWIANAFVTANGGKLRADSEGTGQGATVSIYLPAAGHAAVPMERVSDE